MKKQASKVAKTAAKKAKPEKKAQNVVLQKSIKKPAQKKVKKPINKKKDVKKSKPKQVDKKKPANKQVKI